MKYLLALFLLPVIAFGQNSEPVKSIKTDAYKKLIEKDMEAPASVSERPDTLSLGLFSGTGKSIRKIKFNNNAVNIYAQYPLQLRISGNYAATLELRSPGQQPALQSAFGQGRSSATGLIWQGPETNEVFSYGPALASLEYDGIPYAYDKNGKLVPEGHGDGQRAIPYSNSIFRTAAALTQHFNLQGRIMSYNSMVHELKLGIDNTNEQTYIQYHNNAHTTFNISYSTVQKWLNLTAKYNRSADSYSNSNNGGFLNRAYQETLLTPPAFDLTQGYKLAEGQRSYSNKANNPFYLLKDNDNYAQNLHQQASLLLKRNAYKKIKYSLMQTVEYNNSRSHESYKPYTAWFPDGISANRSKKDKLYEINAGAEKGFNWDRFTGAAEMTYGLSDNQTNLAILPFNNYHYQRTAQESRQFFKLTYNSYNANRVGLSVGNNIYVSNTALKNYFVLPQATVDGIYNFRYSNWWMGGAVSYSDAVSENPVNQSYAYSNLTRISIAQAPSYFPVQEARTIDGLEATRHKDIVLNFRAENQKAIDFLISFYSKKVINEVAPVLNQQEINLTNIGDHLTKGFDVTISRSWNASNALHNWSLNHQMIFSTYKTKVTRAGNHNFLALNGFNDLHTAWVEGQPINAIVGSAWIRDTNNNLLIGDDGYPAPQKSLQVIGDPNPDFMLKFNNTVIFDRNWTLSVSLEWKKGGEKWNGTQAMLDYYGVSAISGTQRDTKSYVFDGVRTDGTKNTTPVDFYDPKNSIYDNRWVRYGPGGVGEAYIQKADWLRLNNLSFGRTFKMRKVIQRIDTQLYVSNLLLWTPYKGVDPAQMLFDMTGAQGLDYFNLPGLKTYGFNVSIQF